MSHLLWLVPLGIRWLHQLTWTESFQTLWPGVRQRQALWCRTSSTHHCVDVYSGCFGTSVTLFNRRKSLLKERPHQKLGPPIYNSSLPNNVFTIQHHCKVAVVDVHMSVDVILYLVNTRIWIVLNLNFQTAGGTNSKYWFCQQEPALGVETNLKM